MKLINTIKRLVEEAETNYYEASMNPINEKEIERLEENVEYSKKLLKRFNELNSKK
jgi:hypothetical protein